MRRACQERAGAARAVEVRVSRQDYWIGVGIGLAVLMFFTGILCLARYLICVGF